MRRALLLVFVFAAAFASNGYPDGKGRIDYTVRISGARSIKTRLRAPLTCQVLTQFGLRDDHQRLFGFQFQGETPCDTQSWPAERWTYDHIALTEIYIGASGDERVAALAKTRFANNEKAHTTVVLRPDATGTIAFDNLMNQRQEFVSGTIEFRIVR
jgi:hypothetical protein